MLTLTKDLMTEVTTRSVSAKDINKIVSPLVVNLVNQVRAKFSRIPTCQAEQATTTTSHSVRSCAVVVAKEDCP